MPGPSRTERRYGLTHDSVILHCPGPLRMRGGYFDIEWLAACQLALSDDELRGNCDGLDGITVVTYCNRGEQTLLEHGLDFLGIRKFAVLRTAANSWNQRYKLTLLLEWLEGGRCNSEYLLCLDADDSLFVNDPRLILDRFRATQCEILFGATMADAPPSPECWAFENSVSEYTDPMHAHLNAGGFLGRTDFIKAAAREILDACQADPVFCEGRKGFSDQLGWRHMHRRYYPRIKIDCGCRIFLRFDQFR